MDKIHVRLPVTIMIGALIAAGVFLLKGDLNRGQQLAILFGSMILVGVAYRMMQRRHGN